MGRLNGEGFSFSYLLQPLLGPLSKYRVIKDMTCHCLMRVRSPVGDSATIKNNPSSLKMRKESSVFNSMRNKQGLDDFAFRWIDQPVRTKGLRCQLCLFGAFPIFLGRSEEHTSELQS